MGRFTVFGFWFARALATCFSDDGCSLNDIRNL
jgi:hypothetical protein